MEVVKNEEIYTIAMPSFIVNGGDAYDMVKKNKIRQHLTGWINIILRPILFLHKISAAR